MIRLFYDLPTNSRLPANLRSAPVAGRSLAAPPAIRRRGFTLVELLVVITIIATLVGMLTPAIQSVLALSRKTSCMNNMKNLGTALRTFHESKKYYPPSCATTKTGFANQRDRTLTRPSYESWSWIAYLLPYLDREQDFNELNKCRFVMPWSEIDASVPRVQQVRETTLRFLVCPAVGAKDFTGPQLRGYSTPTPSIPTLRGALGNYKCMGGSVKESIALAVNKTLAVPYGKVDIHPDGVLFPSSDDRGVPDVSVTDGLSHTIMLAETIEDKYARWLLGTEANLAGLPSADDPAGCGPTLGFIPRLNLYAPIQFDGKFGGDSLIPPNIKTYLDYNYHLKQNMYDHAQGVKYGPSSRHPSGVNHLFCDGNIRTIPLDIDVAAYMFLITRRGDEPFGNYLASKGIE